MFDTDERLLYVGKARDIRRRLASYFGNRPLSAKVAAMLRHLARIEVTRTHSETEALLLESNLIKRYRPRYNVLLRDDKSYPYIRLEDSLGFPRLSLYRGPRRAGARYYGPYPSAGAARATLGELQRVFRLRNCSDQYFRNRIRACLQYQIGRCSAPCVGLIDPDVYARDLKHALAFLSGHNERVVEDLAVRMEAAAARLEFEQAGLLRDQIRHLRQIQSHQVMVTGTPDCDVLAVALVGSRALVEIVPVRGGRVLGSRRQRLSTGAEDDPAVVLAGFMAQYYLEHEPPPRIVPGDNLDSGAELALVLSGKWGREIQIKPARQGALRRLVRLAAVNACAALDPAPDELMWMRYRALETALGLNAGILKRIECFDISHTGGEATTGSCVVFDRDGPLKSAYRRYRIEGLRPGDDYAALEQVLERRYRRLVEEEGEMPDMVLVDGGPAQVRRAAAVLERMHLEQLLLAGVSKGEGRRPEFDRLVLGPKGITLGLASDSPALHLVQALRDEAHRFAITGHRRTRERRRRESILESIPGIGPLRQRRLLTRFGGLQGLKRASAEDLAKVPGINRALAERIVRHLSPC